VYTVLGIPPKIFGSQNVFNLAAQGLNDVVGAVFAVEPDPLKGLSFQLVVAGKSFPGEETGCTSFLCISTSCRVSFSGQTYPRPGRICLSCRIKGT
jgi:hypothetical protein